MDCQHEWRTLTDEVDTDAVCIRCDSVRHLDGHIEEPSYCEECKDTHTGKCW